MGRRKAPSTEEKIKKKATALLPGLALSEEL